MKKLKLEKSTIANLNEKEMTKIEGGQETMAGPKCVSVEPTCAPAVTINVPCR